MNSEQAAKKWGLSSRRVRLLCHNKKIPGAYLKGKTWIIPDDLEKPLDNRYSSNKVFSLSNNKTKYNSVELAWLIRRHVIEMGKVSHSSHISSNFSEADVLAVLYNNILNVYPNNPKNENRDFFILSKGHAVAAYYAVLAEMGFISKDILLTFDGNNSILQGHSTTAVPGIEMNTGSLGHGLSYAAGIAYSLKRDGKYNKVYVLLGDGECDEGSVYEALNLAQQLKLDNLVVLVDINKMSAMGYTKDIINLEKLDDKFRAFNFDTFRIDGHNHNDIYKTLIALENNNKPHAVLLDTIKGYPVKLMMDDILWHYRYPHEETGEYKTILDQLNEFKPKGVEDPYEN